MPEKNLALQYLNLEKFFFSGLLFRPKVFFVSICMILFDFLGINQQNIKLCFLIGWCLVTQLMSLMTNHLGCNHLRMNFLLLLAMIVKYFCSFQTISYNSLFVFKRKVNFRPYLTYLTYLTFFSTKMVNGFKLLIIFAKKFDCRFFVRF